MSKFETQQNLADLELQKHRDFLMLFSTNQSAVQGFVRSLLSGREDVREVMQEIAVVLWEKFDQFDSSRDFRKWACGVARYEVLSFIRDRSRDRHVFDDSLLNTLAEEAISGDQGEHRKSALESCLEKISTKQKDLVLKAYEPDCRIDALAEQRGQTAMSLYKVLHRIRRTLFECIQQKMKAEGLE